MKIIYHSSALRSTSDHKRAGRTDLRYAVTSEGRKLNLIKLRIELALLAIEMGAQIKELKNANEGKIKYVSKLCENDFYGLLLSVSRVNFSTFTVSAISYVCHLRERSLRRIVDSGMKKNSIDRPVER